MPTSTQLLKAYGQLPTVALDDLGKDSALTVAGLVDSDVLAHRTCGHPDAPDDEIAAADANTLGAALSLDMEEAAWLKAAHVRMAAAGSGSWPPGCHTDIYPYPDRHCITLYVRRSTFNNNWMRPTTDGELRHIHKAGVWPWSIEQLLDRWLGKPLLDVALEFLHEAYRRVGFWTILVDEEPKADIVLLCRFISGSTIGIGWFMSPQQGCRDTVESHYDSSWQPALYQAILLLCHEVGHNVNLQHQFRNQSGPNGHRGVMSYSWPNNAYGFLTGAEGILPRDPSWGPLTEFTGGEPIDDPVEPEPKPPLTPTGKPQIDDIVVRIADVDYVYEVKLKGDDDIPIGV